MSKNNKKAVEVFELEKKFGDFTAVNRISFEVGEGEIFGFLGPNGAGKSTTIRMLCGILRPTSGRGNVGGFDINKEQEKIKQIIGYMSQKFSLYEDLTVEENINFYSGLYNIKGQEKKVRRDWIVQMAGLENFGDRLTRELSIGWKQRLALGCAIIHKPKILFLDEPTSGVDPISRRDFWNMIKQMAKEGVTVFVTTHYMGEANNCDRLALIFRGELTAIGTPEELRTNYMKGFVLKISLPKPEQWLDRLSALDFISETALFGADIHIVVPDVEVSIGKLNEFLKQQGCANFRIEEVQASLEDVFVSLIESSGREK